MADKIEGKKEIDNKDTIFIGNKDVFVYSQVTQRVLRRFGRAMIKARYPNFLKAIDTYFMTMQLMGENSNQRFSENTHLWVTEYEDRNGQLRYSKEMGIIIEDILNHTDTPTEPKKKTTEKKTSKKTTK